MKLNKILTVILLAVSASSAFAQQTSVYVRDTRGFVVKNNTGQCWRTGYWNAVDAANDPSVCECDPGAVSELVCMRNFNNPPQVQPPMTAMPPVQQAAPTQKQPLRVTLREDISFKFAQSVLQNQAKSELDNVVNVANDVAADRIVVTGHTDRIGSERYNMELSQRRADAVKRYLVEKGLPYNMITAQGAGESKSITGSRCDNIGKESHSNKALVECLAPDRRVDIDIYGTR